jgi:hypothetical protein
VVSATERKQCSQCKEKKPFRYFPKDKKRKDGHFPTCNACRKTNYFDPNREAINERRKAVRRTPEGRYGQMLGSSKYREISCDLTLEQYKALIVLPCHYCSGGLPEAGTGLDRLDNTLGYTFSNVIPCCTECNRIRGNFLTVEEMEAVAALLKEMRSSRGELP